MQLDQRALQSRVMYEKKDTGMGRQVLPAKLTRDGLGWLKGLFGSVLF